MVMSGDLMRGRLGELVARTRWQDDVLDAVARRAGVNRRVLHTVLKNNVIARADWRALACELKVPV